jgi:RNA polymerase sigma factor (sigma-70 family)
MPPTTSTAGKDARAGDDRPSLRRPIVAREKILALTTAMAAGSEPAFDRFHDAYAEPLHHYLLARARGREDVARDALQETLLRVIRYVKPFHRESDLWNWVRRLAKTALVDQWRRLSRGGCAEMGPAAEKEPARVEDPTSALLDHLESCLGLLDEGDRRLVSGKYLDGKSVKRLAREEGTTAKAVESRLVRARKKLKTFILERLKNDS